MAPRRYGQHCGLARALEVLGERWTLLVVRELALGPKRYRDLLHVLPGIGTNLLAARLRTLREADVIHQVHLGPPAGVSAYALTARGQELRPAVEALAVWGAGLLPRRPAEGDLVRASLAAMGMAVLSSGRLPVDLTVLATFDVDGDVFFVRAEHGHAMVTNSPLPSDPTVTVTCDMATFEALATGARTPTQLADGGRATITGNLAPLERLFQTLRIHPGPA